MARDRKRREEGVRIIESTDRDAVSELLSPQRVRDAETDRRVAEIVADVRRHGDAALLRYARTYDGLDGDAEISRKQMAAAARFVPAPVRRALRRAATNIRTVAKRQVPRGWKTRVSRGINSFYARVDVPRTRSRIRD